MEESKVTHRAVVFASGVAATMAQLLCFSATWNLAAGSLGLPKIGIAVAAAFIAAGGILTAPAKARQSLAYVKAEVRTESIAINVAVSILCLSLYAGAWLAFKITQ